MRALLVREFEPLESAIKVAPPSERNRHMPGTFLAISSDQLVQGVLGLFGVPERVLCHGLDRKLVKRAPDLRDPRQRLGCLTLQEQIRCQEEVRPVAVWTDLQRAL